ncbi:TerB family tellurite resistance protein [Flavobacterium sp.]|uniref:TerB family tellurite resistance protein n=1 Tax=Flavobacterium sp. TaxID=239 RepID=UPI002616953D|nr:TerB family tellurite resistance protein [Flavobacterium sp.]MDG2431416.1 TerB family tellurite resistance protein [Flavobacterium sp.]
MSFSDLFDSEFKQRNKGHFSSIVRLALADGVFAPEERAFLDKLAIRLEISAAEYEEILENPTKYPINPPYLNAQRIERLYDLARMVNIDHHLGDNQEVMLHKLSLGIGFTPENVHAVVTKALELADKKADLDTFLEEIEKVEKLNS